MEVHLVDATYELFRAHFSPRPPVLGRDGQVLSGVSGLVEQLCYLLREQGGTHVGCATDRVIESFRNDLYPGYKTSAGMPPELLAQFPIAEQAIEALGVTLWPMVEFEADDAIAAAAERFAADPAVERILICTPDKDMAQLVQDERVVLWDRRRETIYDDAGVRAKWGVAPESVPDRLALVGDAADGFPGLPGWGDKGASAVLARYGHLEDIPSTLELAVGTTEKLGRLPFGWWHVWRAAEKVGAATPKHPVIFECVGMPGVIESIVDSAPLFSRVVVVGVCVGADRFKPAMAINKEIDLRFVIGYTPLEFRDTLHMLAEGGVDPRPMITGEVGLEGVEGAFAALGDPERHAKILIDPARQGAGGL